MAKTPTIKKWYLSWTLWLNVGVILLEAVTQILELVPAPAGWSLYAVGVLNILLRIKTKEPIV